MVSYRTMVKWLVLPDENILSETKNIVKFFDFGSDRD